MKIRLFGHASFQIEAAGKVIHIDPYVLQMDFETPDLILSTHRHYDHCDTEKIELVRDVGTEIIVTKGSEGKIFGDVRVVKAGNIIDFSDEIRIIAVHAYNIGKPSHPKGMGVGFIIESEGKRIYHAGDTDLIPEMSDLGEITVALLPVGGKCTMNAGEAADAVKIIKPKIAVPMHFGKIIGTRADAERFKELVEKETKTRVEILDGGKLEV